MITKQIWTPLRVLFVGDEPSSRNVNRILPFVGTASYKRLLKWIGELDLDISRVSIRNSNIKSIRDDWVPDRIIFLGPKSKAQFEKNNPEFLVYSDYGYMELGLHQFDYNTVPKTTIDHPSPRNRNFNDPNYEKKMLKNLKKWIYK